MAVILTAHSGVDYQQLADWSSAVVDTRNAMAGVRPDTGNIWKA